MRGGVPIGADRDPLDALIPQTCLMSWPFFDRGPASMPIYSHTRPEPIARPYPALRNAR